MDPLRFGIVGCAGIGTTHAEVLDRIDGAALVACADLDADAAGEFADEYEVPAQYEDVSTMVAESDVDAVSVCTPSGTHAEVTVEAAEAGAHVLCEKPLDVYADRMDRMIEACDDAGVTLAGVFQKRFHPASRRAKEAVESGGLGDLVLADAAIKWFRSDEYYASGGWRGTRDMDGGVLLNQAVHDVDRLQWLAGDVESVSASLDRSRRDIECETAAAISLRFENGALGTVSATTVTKGGRDRIELDGAGGSLCLSGGGIERYETGTGEESEYWAGTEERAVDLDVENRDWNDDHAALVRDFVESVREGREPAVPGREARKAVDLVLAAYASDARGERVSVADVRDGRIPEARSDAER